jgi:hypothetical protein
MELLDRLRASKSYMSLGPIKKCVSALVKDDESNVKDGPNLVLPSIRESVPDRLVYSVQVELIVPVSPWKRSDDCLLVQNPHPQLIHHDELGDLFDLTRAMFAAVGVRFAPGTDQLEFCWHKNSAGHNECQTHQ